MNFNKNKKTWMALAMTSIMLMTTVTAYGEETKKEVIMDGKGESIETPKTVDDSHYIPVYIDSADQLLRFSEKCAYDLYSKDKNVVITRDINLDGVAFTGIPSFSGEFDGGNHTISGFSLDLKGSTFGFFRTLGESGMVHDLNVEATYKLTGSNSEIGGLVGVNYGKIMDVSFNGNIYGTDRVGGIAGVNQHTGVILNASVSGEITGEHHTGGIVGENIGYIEGCLNQADVNTTNKTTPVDVESIEMDKIRDNEAVVAHTDSGGITGSNMGIIMKSHNKGTIGYPHIGYNVGGIAGRQSGFISGCINEGAIYGRKDVAGIVGQMEPDVQVNYTKDYLDEISGEMDQLKDEIDVAITHTESANKAITARFNALSRSVDQSSDYLNLMVESTTTYVDDTSDQVNEVVDRIDIFIEDMTKVTESAKLAVDEMTLAFSELESGFSYLEDSSEHVTDGLEDVDVSLQLVSAGIQDMNAGIQAMQEAITHLQNASTNNESLDQALEEMEAAMKLMQPAVDATSKAMTELVTALSNVEDIRDLRDIEIDPAVVDELVASQDNFRLAFEQLELAMGHIQDEYEKDTAEIDASMTYLNNAMAYFSEAAAHFNVAVAYMNAAVDDFILASEDMESGMDEFSDGMLYFRNASSHLSQAIDYLDQAIDKQVAKEDIVFPKLGEYVSEHNEQFFKSLDQISADMTALSNTVSSSGNTVTGDLRKINDRFFVITDLVKEAIDEMQAAKEEIYLDISEEGLVDPTNESYFTDMEPINGFVVLSENHGDISGDINIGGIAGAMSVEMDFDPESEYTAVGDSSFNFQLQTKAILANSKNSGTIQSKKDYVGGIVGRADLGSVLNSENYSLVESTDGSYVGGIVGASYATIRNSYSMSKISGYDYVGGVAGYGTNVYDSKSMIHIEEEEDFANNHEKVGSIAGSRDSENGEFIGNVFVESKWQGVDMISYESMAAPISYKDFLAIEEMPASYKNLTITFVLGEGEEVEYPFKYGQAITADQLPEIPEKEGYYSEWPEYDFNNLTFSDQIKASYHELIPVIEATNEEGSLKEEAGNSPAKLLAEGQFYPSDSLVVKPYNSRFSITDVDGKVLLGSVEEQWEVELDTQLEDGSNRYRLYLPGEEDRTIYVKDNNSWNKVDVEKDGSYFVFYLPSNHAILTVFKNQAKDYTWYIIEAGGFVVLLMLVILYQKKKHGKGGDGKDKDGSDDDGGSSDLVLA